MSFFASHVFLRLVVVAKVSRYVIPALIIVLSLYLFLPMTKFMKVITPLQTLAVGVAIAAADMTTAIFLPNFYVGYMTGELGIVENLQAFVLLAGLLFTLWMLAQKRLFPAYVRPWLGMMAICYVYLLGEEISWGQHYMGWTAEGWFALNNDQLETNVHNTSSWFDQKPRGLILIGVFLGGVLHPLLHRWRGRGLFDKPWWMAPTFVLLPLALITLLVQLPETIEKTNLLPFSLMIANLRFSELQELLLYSYFLAYLLLLRERLMPKVQGFCK